MAKIEELMKNTDFVENLTQAQTAGDVKMLFNANGVEMTDDDVINFVNEYNSCIDSIGKQELNEEDLVGVNGGVVVSGTALAITAALAALTAIGAPHTYKKIKNETSCTFKGVSAYPNSPFYQCK